MMAARTGYPIDLELIDINGELWLRTGGGYRGGSIMLTGLNPYGVEYFMCMVMYDPLGILQVNPIKH